MITAKLQKIALNIFYGLLAYMPLHILLSTWIGTSWYILPFMKVAKDIVLVVGFLSALTVSVRQTWFKGLVKDRLVQIIVAYGLLTLLLALVRPTDADAEVLGLVYNTRFLVMFLYAVLLSRLYSASELLQKSVRIIVGVGLLVAFLGVLQYTVLPNDYLSSFGYSRQNGVLPAFFIDDKPDLERVMSTLRDPNSLGSYLIIIVSFCLVGVFLNWHNKHLRQLMGGALTLAGLCLLLTFSRSAWLGMLFAVIAIFLVYKNKLPISKENYKRVMFVGIASVVVLSSLLLVTKSSYFVQNVVFHADQSTVLEDPNQLRVRFLQESMANIAAEPLGQGPGTAGLASIKNDAGGRLNENYYLQIATEVGLLGLMLFLAILYMVFMRLWQQRSSPLVLALLASFVGLFITNMLVHIWSNEAVAYTWWALAGLVVFSQQKVLTKQTK